MTSSSEPLLKPTEAKAVTTKQPIPFRQDSVAKSPEVFGLLMTTLLMLALFAALAWYARRRGWLNKWVGVTPQPTSTNKKIVVLEVQRISQKTTLYRISNGEEIFLLAESSMQIQLQPSSIKMELQNV
jgi:flagellar biogenesis protein FliO